MKSVSNFTSLAKTASTKHLARLMEELKASTELKMMVLKY